MADSNEPRSPQTYEYVPSTGLIHETEIDQLILCKPKLMPLKSVTLEKLENMQKDAENKLKEQYDNKNKISENS